MQIENVHVVKDDDDIVLTREKALQLMFEFASELGYEVTLAQRPVDAPIN